MPLDMQVLCQKQKGEIKAAFGKRARPLDWHTPCLAYIMPKEIQKKMNKNENN